jgi:hypothetical protein
MDLTIERLNGEYISWAVEFLDGRNRDDLRFGQYITNKYNLDEDCPDVFYYEGAEFAYKMLLNYLEINEVKNTL